MSELRTEAAAPSAPAGTEPPSRRAWLGLAVILLAAFMELLDVTAVTVASSEIQGSFHTSYAQVQWLPAGCQLTFAAGLVAGGRLGDIYSCRRSPARHCCAASPPAARRSCCSGCSRAVVKVPAAEGAEASEGDAERRSPSGPFVLAAPTPGSPEHTRNPAR
ncbi:MFS transporter [Streptomyces sp. NPDC127197]|uniref:MFS transporter n=1 Tax=Streptomyces sp. NPDC127197 TaxID=3345388 RepID=UPI0036377E97